MTIECKDCGEEIPAARFRITGKNICVDCTRLLEKSGVIPRYRMEIIGSGDLDNFEVQTFMTKSTTRAVTPVVQEES